MSPTYYRRRSERNKKKRRNFPQFTLVTWLIIINVFLSLIALVLFASSEVWLDYLALKPVNIFEGKYLWTLVTHMFIHGGITHLLLNMLVLYSLGTLCEKIIGQKRFIWFYLISGLFAGVLSVVLAGFLGTTELGARIFGSPEIFMVGASGAIFAIAGLYVMLLPKLRFMIIFLPFFSLPAYIMVPGLLVITWIASIIGNWPIGNVAHFGGFLAGVIYGVYLRSKYKRKIQKLQRMFR